VIQSLKDAAVLSGEKVLNPENLSLHDGITADSVVLVVLAAGKGTRFGQAPKCIQPVSGTPLARHSVDAFRRFSPSPVICLVGYRHQEVSAALGSDLYVRSDDPAGGPVRLEHSRPGFDGAQSPLVISMGDAFAASVFRHLRDPPGRACGGPRF
jgi:2-C-methyl-D-erythritol 4-phosphate cytidylyltransferase